MPGSIFYSTLIFKVMQKRGQKRQKNKNNNKKTKTNKQKTTNKKTKETNKTQPPHWPDRVNTAERWYKTETWQERDRRHRKQTNKPTFTLGKQKQQNQKPTKVFKHALKNIFPISQFLLVMIDYTDFRRPKSARSNREYNMKVICNKQKRVIQQVKEWSWQTWPECITTCPEMEIWSDWNINTVGERIQRALRVLERDADNKTDDIFCGALGIRGTYYPPSFSTPALKMSQQSCHLTCSPQTSITKNIILRT